MKIINFVIMVLFSQLTFSAAPCHDLMSCMNAVGQLTGKKYLTTDDIKPKKFLMGQNFSLTAENADALFTAILDLNEPARIPTSNNDTYTTVKSRDVR